MKNKKPEKNIKEEEIKEDINIIEKEENKGPKYKEENNIDIKDNTTEEEQNKNLKDDDNEKEKDLVEQGLIKEDKNTQT